MVFGAYKIKNRRKARRKFFTHVLDKYSEQAALFRPAFLSNVWNEPDRPRKFGSIDDHFASKRGRNHARCARTNPATFGRAQRSGETHRPNSTASETK